MPRKFRHCRPKCSEKKRALKRKVQLMKQYTCTCVYLLCAVSTSVLHVCTQTISSCVSCACVSLLSLFQASLPSLQDFYSSIPTLPAGWANQTTTTVHRVFGCRGRLPFSRSEAIAAIKEGSLLTSSLLLMIHHCQKGQGRSNRAPFICYVT